MEAELYKSIIDLNAQHHSTLKHDILIARRSRRLLPPESKYKFKVMELDCIRVQPNGIYELSELCAYALKIKEFDKISG